MSHSTSLSLDSNSRRFQDYSSPPAAPSTKRTLIAPRAGIISLEFKLWKSQGDLLVPASFLIIRRPLFGGASGCGFRNGCLLLSILRSTEGCKYCRTKNTLNNICCLFRRVFTSWCAISTLYGLLGLDFPSSFSLGGRRQNQNLRAHEISCGRCRG